MYISSVSIPVKEPYQTSVSLRQSILCGYDNVSSFFFFFFFGGGGGGGAGGLICLIVLAVKLLNGF